MANERDRDMNDRDMEEERSGGGSTERQDSSRDRMRDVNQENLRGVSDDSDDDEFEDADDLDDEEEDEEEGTV